MEDDAFMSWFAAELAGLPQVEAVALGGSRASGTARASSDWDFAVYYRGEFQPGSLRQRGWPGEVSEVGGWGGGVMNGGAWLTLQGRRVDAHYRDRDEVEHWCAEARAGRFQKQLLLSYVAGIPTYVVMAELARNVVLAGQLPRPEYPVELSRSAERRWTADARHSLAYAQVATDTGGDLLVAVANAARGLIEAAHARLAARREWVLNEKGMVERAELGAIGAQVVAARSAEELGGALDGLRQHLEHEGTAVGPDPAFVWASSPSGDDIRIVPS